MNATKLQALSESIPATHKMKILSHGIYYQSQVVHCNHCQCVVEVIDSTELRMFKAGLLACPECGWNFNTPYQSSILKDIYNNKYLEKNNVHSNNI